MKIITTTSLIQNIATAWREAYVGHMDTIVGKTGQTREEIARSLDALDPKTATPEDITRIIGNGSWTSITCDECKASVTEAVEVGEEQAYESRTATLCRACLMKAAALFPTPPSA